MRVASHERALGKCGNLAKVFYAEIRLVGNDIGTVRHRHWFALEDAHGEWADAPFEGDSGSTQQERLGRVCTRKRLVPRHLCAYELISIINERKECAIAVHLVHAMLDEGVEGYVAAGDWFGRRSFWDVEGERRGREISRAVLATGIGNVTSAGNSHAAISYARTRSWLSIAAGGVVVEMGAVVAMVHYVTHIE